MVFLDCVLVIGIFTGIGLRSLIMLVYSGTEVAEMSDVRSIRKALREERTMLAAARRCSDAELAAESLKLIEGFELMLAEALVKARKGMVKGGVPKADESPGKPAVVPSRDGRSR